MLIATKITYTTDILAFIYLFIYFSCALCEVQVHVYLNIEYKRIYDRKLIDSPLE